MVFVSATIKQHTGLDRRVILAGNRELPSPLLFGARLNTRRPVALPLLRRGDAAAAGARAGHDEDAFRRGVGQAFVLRPARRARACHGDDDAFGAVVDRGLDQIA